MKKYLVLGVILLFVGLAVSPSIYADNKMSLDPVADLDCSGEVDWVNIQPGATYTAEIYVENIGEQDSLLDWEITKYPSEWGDWTFDPWYGENLLYGETFTIDITLIAPEDLNTPFDGEIILTNSDNEYDYCTICVSISPYFQGVFSSYSNVGNTIFDPVADLDCAGGLEMVDVVPGSTVNGEFYIENVGEQSSFLDWEVVSYPDWGEWAFNPDSGVDLISGDSETVEVEIIVPEEQNTEFIGEIMIVNSEDDNDVCYIQVSTITSYYKNDYNDYTPIQLVFLLINKLRYYDVEDDSEINSIIEELESYNCGCEDDSSEFQWGFPFICTLLYPIFIISVVLLMLFSSYNFYWFMEDLAKSLNCYWAKP